MTQIYSYLFSATQTSEDDRNQLPPLGANELHVEIWQRHGGFRLFQKLFYDGGHAAISYVYNNQRYRRVAQV